MMPAEWTPHDGGERPSELADNTPVKVRFRHQQMESRNFTPAKNWIWKWHQEGSGGDIIAYRLAQPQENEDDAS